jgi:uncharacterized protein
LYASAVAVGTAAVSLDGFVESNYPHLVRTDIPLVRLPESFNGFTIAQLSDFHYDRHFSVVAIRKAVRTVNDLKPDVVVLTGDFVTAPAILTRSSRRRAANTAAPCAAILQELEAPLGRFAVLGNHDRQAGGERITSILAEQQIPLLRNRSVPLQRGADRIWLVGIDDALKGRPDLEAAIAKVPAAETKILLVHEPDFADESSLSPIDLQLSGHSHGGQIWIPGIGAPWLPPLSRKYPRGMYKVGNLTLYTNIGLGTIRVPVRINCQPEVTLITLRRGQPSSGDQK